MKRQTIIMTALATIILLLFTIRLISPRELDDVTPGILCQQKLLEKANILWVIPIFQNNSIASNAEWCNSILALNKTLGMHGVYHTYNEFQEIREQEYIQEGIQAFQSCFQQTPSKFKPPQLAYTRKNDITLKQFNLKRKGNINQLMHKVYHCNDTGLFPNKFIDWF